ncbi:MAG: sel1 repeat family protein [Colwellia sp.]|nr:sel1 repeat family protein [Colwellia sp.]
MRKNFLLTLLFTITCSVSTFTLANDYDLGLYELNRGEFKAAMAQFEPLAMDGFSPAQYQLAMMYKNAQGTVKNINKAFELLTLAADQNDSDAQFDLSLMYSNGVATEKNLITAFQLMEKSATKGLASAQFNLAVMYSQGSGMKVDNLKASRWYQAAADQNYALAQFNLALMYFEGKGVEKSIEKSFIWNTIASYNGYTDATKSRDMDAHKMTKAKVSAARLKADDMYLKIIEQTEIKARKASKSRFY